MNRSNEYTVSFPYYCTQYKSTSLWLVYMIFLVDSATEIRLHDFVPSQNMRDVNAVEAFTK